MLTRTGAPYSFVVPETTFVDPDDDPLTYSTEFLGAWATFDPETREISGTPGDLDIGVDYVNVIALDPTGGDAIAIMELTIEKNFLPRGNVRIEDFSLPLNEEWTYVIPENTFVDVNADELTITIENIPSWLSYDDETKTFTGTPTTDWTYTLNVKADDGWYGIVTDDFILVTGRGRPNSPPSAGTIPE